MSSRRTKKQKLKVKRPFLSKPNLAIKLNKVEPTVKREFQKSPRVNKLKKKKTKFAKFSAQAEHLGTIKRDIIKSLTLATLILGLETMIYFFWMN